MKRRFGTYALWAVTALGFAYLFIPIIVIAVFSFNDPGKSKFNTQWRSFTWNNWAHGLDNTGFRRALVTSLQVAALSCTIATVLGALIAIALSRYRMRGGALINLLLVLPLTTPEIVMGASLFTLFFNLDVSRGFKTVVIAHAMFCLSFVALTVKARIRGFDWSLEDAAADLYSPPLRTFRKVTLPLIVPGIVAAFLLSVALSIDDYIITSFVAGEAKTLPREIFDSSKNTIPPQVHVIATMILLIAVMVILAGTVIGNRRKAKSG